MNGFSAAHLLREREQRAEEGGLTESVRLTCGGRESSARGMSSWTRWR